MAHDVFISYANQDKPTADAVCATLEAGGVRCWVAPRDVLPGSNWAAAIIDALHHARVVVLVFSANSNHSAQVSREVERAANRELPIVPFRIQDVAPSEAMEYFLGSPHWLDAMTPPLERHLQRLVETVKALLARTPAEAPASGETQTPLLQVPPAQPRPNPFRNLTTVPHLGLAVAAGACLIAILAALLLWPRPGPAGKQGLTSQQLFTAIRNLAIEPQDLPSGISLVSKTRIDVEEDNAQHNAVGEVYIALLSSHVPRPPANLDSAFIIYAVFPSENDARARFDEYELAFTVPDIKDGTKCATGSGNNQGTKYGYTQCVVLSRETLTYSDSRVVGDNQQQGNQDDATSLARFGLAHLNKARATPPSAIAVTSGASATTAAGATATATRTATPTPTPLATLPQAVAVVSEDAGARIKAAVVDLDLRALLARFESEFGLVPSRSLTLHLFSDEQVARQRMALLGFSTSDINDFFSSKTASNIIAGTGGIDDVIYLPNAGDLRGTLGFGLASYTLRSNGGFETKDTYPYWFLRGFEIYNQIRFSETQYSYRADAVADAKSGTAPPLGSIATDADAGSFSDRQTNGAYRLDARGEVAIEYIAQRFGAGSIARLLRENSRGTIGRFDSSLQALTNMTLDQLDRALNDWLKAM